MALPTEIIENILDTSDLNQLQGFCNSNKRNNEICKNYMIHKIKILYNTPITLYKKLMLFSTSYIKFDSRSVSFQNSESIDYVENMDIVNLHQDYNLFSFISNLKSTLELFSSDEDNGREFPSNSELTNDDRFENILINHLIGYTLKNNNINITLNIYGVDGTSCIFIINTPKNNFFIKNIEEMLKKYNVFFLAQPRKNIGLGWI